MRTFKYCGHLTPNISPHAHEGYESILLLPFPPQEDDDFVSAAFRGTEQDLSYSSYSKRIIHGDLYIKDVNYSATVIQNLIDPEKTYVIIE